MLLLILDSLGGTELLVILVVALVIFGPRKLPQLSRSLGRSLADFKRATSDFKETWEKEARIADELKEMSIGRAMLPPEESRSTGATVQRGSVPGPAADGFSPDVDGNGAAAEAEQAPANDAISAALVEPPSIRPVPADAALAQGISGDESVEPAATVEQTRKQDWL